MRGIKWPWDWALEEMNMQSIPRPVVVFGVAMLLVVLVLFGLEVANLAKANAPISRSFSAWLTNFSRAQPIFYTVLGSAMTLLANRLVK